jgi:hypothetical protein
MTRKQRKRLRKVKQPKSSDLNRLARNIVKLLPKRTYTNEGRFCPSCEQPYCQGFDGIEVRCETCYYLSGCMKKNTTIKLCKRCENVKLRNLWPQTDI